MTPVNQTIKGGKLSNCLQAATASYFDLELSEVPNFMLFGRDNHYYFKAFHLFVSSIGYESFGYTKGLPPEDGKYHMAHVEFSEKHASGHVVIWKDGKIVHDPFGDGVHPSDNITGYYKIEKRH